MLNIIGVCFFIVYNIMKHVRLSYLSVHQYIYQFSQSITLTFLAVWRYFIDSELFTINSDADGCAAVANWCY